MPTESDAGPRTRFFDEAEPVPQLIEGADVPARVPVSSVKLERFAFLVLRFFRPANVSK
jgi:hypothetical protein